MKPKSYSNNTKSVFISIHKGIWFNFLIFLFCVVLMVIVYFQCDCRGEKVVTYEGINDSYETLMGQEA